MPKRLSSYLVAILLIALVAIVFYLMQALESPELKRAIEKGKGKPNAQPQSQSAASVPLSSVTPPPIDPANLERALKLNAPDSTVHDDLQVVHEFIDLYRRAFGGNPVGLNEDITAAITGTADPSRPGRVFPPSSPAIRDGKLVDRWGTPYWFHPESGTKMEIRSAGPDRNLFTEDDVILNP